MARKQKLKVTSQTFLSRAERIQVEEADSYEVEEKNSDFEPEAETQSLSKFETQSLGSKRKLDTCKSNQLNGIFLDDTVNDENQINGVRKPQASNSIINFNASSSSSSSNLVQRPITNELQSFILDKTQSESSNFERRGPIIESRKYSIFNTGNSKVPATTHRTLPATGSTHRTLPATGSTHRTLPATGSTHRTLPPNARSNSRSRSISIPKINNIKHKPENHNQKECLDGFSELRSQLASFKSRFCSF